MSIYVPYARLADISDDQITAAIPGDNGIGCRVHQLFRRLRLDGPDYSRLRRRLLKLERAGKIVRHERCSACNSIFWIVKGESS